MDIVASGRWSVAGGRGMVVSGRWQVVGFYEKKVGDNNFLRYKIFSVSLQREKNTHIDMTKRLFYALLLMALMPVAAQAQADAKLIAKAEKGDPAAMVLLGECYENGAGVPQDSTIALRWFQKAADMGDGEAWLRVSRYYLRSTLLPRDTARYVAIRKEWAEKGLPNALAAMHVIYESGIGVAVDSAKALEYLQQAVKKGSKWGYLYLGYCYANGEYGYEKNEKKAVASWQKSWKDNEYDAGLPLTNYYVDKKDYKTAWKYINEGLKWNEPWACERAATMYFAGYGVDGDEAKAQELIADAAKKFPVDEVLSMAGLIYSTCDNEALRDTARAVAYWKRSAENKGFISLSHLSDFYYNNDEKEQAYHYYTLLESMKEAHPEYRGYACYQLSIMNYNGMACEANTEEAMRWLKRGADVYGNDRCARVLAAFYEDEEYRDLPEAARYYRMAVDKGDVSALEPLGKLYANNGNSDRAMEYFQEMVDKGDPDGYYWMAVVTDKVEYLQKGIKNGSSQCADVMGGIYETGNPNLGVKQDYKKAAECYLKSENAYAKFQLGKMYLDGNIGKQKPKDIEKGMQLVTEAADAGWLEAIYYVGVCYEEGDYVDSVDYEAALERYRLLEENDVPAGYYKVGYFYEYGLGGLPVDYVKAIDYYRTAADMEHTLALCFLGDAYRQGLEGVLEQDQKKAFELYSRADSLGSGAGTYYVARSYMEGCGVDIDTAAAIPYLYKAAGLGVGNAAYRLADFFNYGRTGFTANGDSALYYYLEGHKNGSAEASYFIGRMLLNEGSNENAVKYLTVAGQRGNVDAIVLLGLCLQEGVGIEPDPVEAHRLFEVAVSRAYNAEAYAQLGLATLQGNGCAEDETLGKRYLDTAVSLGHEKSEYYLGLCHLNGWGCRADTVEAIRHLERAADFGNIRAINTLGDVYEEQGNFKNAVLYFEKGVAQGSLESYCNLGYCYQEGQGVVLNSQKAFELYQVAAEHEYMRGYMLMAQCYLNGMYVEKSVPEAMKWLEKAADAGNPTAMYYLGAYYADGDEGVKPDAKKAKAWYKKAAAAGYAPAQAALERMR